MRMISAVLGAVAALVAGTTAPAAGAAATAPLPVVYSVPAALAYAAAHPEQPPPGANDWSCRPSAAHPRPVVLLHGTLANMTFNWFTLSPLLKNAGYCVYALNYGQEPTRYGGAPGSAHPGGTGPIEQSSAQLATFVDRVRAASGAAKVDIVGHSQGGMMPRHYLRFGGGSAKVGILVGLSPSNHGSDLWGLAALATLPGAPLFLDLVLGPAFAQQAAGSPFMQALNARGETVSGVRYTVIQTRYDQVVTPYTSAFLTGPDVTNITLQDVCGLDLADHVATAFDSIAFRLVLNALDPAHAVASPCHPVLPGVGG